MSDTKPNAFIVVECLDGKPNQTTAYATIQGEIDADKIVGKLVWAEKAARDLRITLDVSDDYRLELIINLLDEWNELQK